VKTAISPILHEYPHLGQWLHLERDGSVHVRSGKVEYGQGIRTAVAQIVAHELYLPPSRVVVEPASTDVTPDEGVTSGSLSVEATNQGLRRAAASLRRALLRRAALRLNKPISDLKLSNGWVLSADRERIAIADLIDDRLARERVDGTVELRAVGPKTPIGTSVRRTDFRAKLTGQAAFIQDIELPGMLHARVCRPPSPGALLSEIDEDAVLSLPGVRLVVRDGSFVAVVANREEEAIRALRRLRRVGRWIEENALPDSPRFMLREPTLDSVVAEHSSGDASVVARRLSATYSRPYLAHASMGPSCALASFDGARYLVWSHSQGIFHLREQLSKVLQVATERICVTHVEGAGCYGANGADDAALDAALVARAMPGTPIRVQWMRDDEFAWEPFGTAMFVSVEAGLTEDGSIAEWTQETRGNGHRDRAAPDSPAHVTNLLAARHLEKPFDASVAPPPQMPTSGGARNAQPIYPFARQRIVNRYVPRTPIRVSALRSLGAHTNVFAIESLMDEIAHEIHVDPIEHRLRYLVDPRARAVIQQAARNSCWDEYAGAEGRGMGIGFARYKNSGAYVAVVIEVELDDEVRLRRVWAAVDAGLAVNPDGITNQISGGIVQAASWTLKEQVKFSRQRIMSREWSTYPILRFEEVPPIEVEVIQRYEEPPCGVGEAAAGPTAAAIGNAVFAASGVRLREMPFTRERFIRAAG
jgi:CO/xanthine dehydrogenase Mo-binding subunit